MSELQTGYEITRRDVALDRALRVGAWSLPVVAAVLPALLFGILFVLSTAPAQAAVWLFMVFAGLIGGFAVGLAVSGGLMFYRSRWLAKVRERLAVDGIRADELDWFRHELTTAERRTLADVEKRDLLLGDAYRDSLAARLTATRIQKTAKQELMLVKRRQSKLRQSKADNLAPMKDELARDFDKLSSIQKEAEAMRLEAENRMHQIETAARHGTNFSETELALKRLAARTQDLPIALESARMEEEIRRELLDEDPGT